MDSLNLSYFIPLVTFLYLAYKYLTATFNYWKDRGLKYEKPIPILGNYGSIFFGNKGIAQLSENLYAKYPDEKMVGIFQTSRPELFVKDLDLIRHVLVKDFDHFSNRLILDSEVNEPLSVNLFKAKTVKWRTMRKKLTPVFTSGKLRLMFPLIVEKAEDFQKYIGEQIKRDEVLDMRELLSQLTTDVIGSVAFGVEMDSMSNTSSPFRRIGKKIIDTNLLRTAKLFLQSFCPSLFNFLGMRVHPKEIQDFFVTTVKDIVKHREETHYQRNDFMNLLIELKKTNKLSVDEKENMDFDDMTMTAQAFIFFIAGFETSSGLMSFALHELAWHPEAMEKVVEEIDTVLKKYEGQICYDAINEMNYLEMVMYEAMRKYPALATLTRFSTKKYTFPNTDITIDKDIPILIPAREIHYDPNYYPNPQEFIPERFSKEEKQGRDPMTFLGFGEGPRICIGLRFGKMQSMVGLVSLLSKYRVERCQKTEKHLTINKKSFVTAPLHGIWLKVSPRKIAS